MARKSKPFKTSLVTCESCGSKVLHATKKDTFPTLCADCDDVVIFKPEV